jgi:predicted amidohydrolase YtcJ
MGGGIAVQHRMAYQGKVSSTAMVKSSFGFSTVKKMLEMGIPVGLGTDGTRVASYNPWVALYWITSGKTLGGTQVMAKENTGQKTALSLSTLEGMSL